MFLNKEYLKFIEDSKQKGLDIVGTSVIETLGSTFAKPGNMMLVNSIGEFTGVLGSPFLHNKILEISKNILKSKESYIFESVAQDESSGHGNSKYFSQPFFLSENYGVLGLSLKNIGKTLVRSIKDNSYKILNEECNTKLEYDEFYQTIKSPYSLLVFGSGVHVKALIEMANIMAWKTTIIDIKMNKYVEDADKLIELEKLEDILTMDLSSYTASVILSHSPKTDDIYLRALLDSNVEYIGMMGNKKNMQSKIEQFGLENDRRFFAPVGFDIGGNTQQSIALSICSQIEARKNGKI
ncbi:XdhC/CoxI family protein [Poseidonibacter lekithochrous]|uniref:XdhC family protein n=1 Tax=Poseidonibacter TaxID=2321187 RepID=UPI001C09D89A|nr:MULTISPECIES: XdhC/CoxI family protein [Poseidonibacter]MBU3015001.1 XdhC/CoxI family protein [Poseidonibacter lekithochrous]MDO6828298.1 XdhC/CoxI family protein [Poseidonibacter sp. 1_MG-2023]